MITALVFIGAILIACIALGAAIWSALIADADLPHWYDDPGDVQ